MVGFRFREDVPTNNRAGYYVSYLTKQQIFDNAYIGILKHGLSYTVGANGQSYCRYRSSSVRSDPCRCAIGHSIPDELYDANMEDDQVTVPDRGSYLGQVFNPDDGHFLSEVLSVHDNLVTRITLKLVTQDDMRDEFTSTMREIAEDYGLTIPPQTEMI